MTPSELRQRIHQLIPQGVIRQGAKADYLSGIIGRTITSSKQCTYIELLKAYYKLRFGNCTWAHYALFNKENKQHMRLISECMAAGWTKWHNNKQVADLERLGRWIGDGYCPVNKPLMNMTSLDLCRKVIPAMQEVGRHQRKKQLQ